MPRKKSEWKAFVGRIVLFPGAPASSRLPSALELYQRVWGTDPDNYHKQTNALMPTVAQGKRGGITTACSIQPMRIDFSFTPSIGHPETPQLSFDLIEDASQVQDGLKQVIEVISRSVVDYVSRVAVNVQFIALKSSIAEANAMLAEILPENYRPKITDEEDFIFQINRPHMSLAVENISMNFITKWSTDRLQVLTLSVPVSGVPSPAQIGLTPASQTKDFIGASVLFDNNNMPSNRPLTGEQQSSLLLEGLLAAEEMQRELGLNVEGF